MDLRHAWTEHTPHNFPVGASVLALGSRRKETAFEAVSLGRVDSEDHRFWPRVEY
jgi:hypothetical protein